MNADELKPGDEVFTKVVIEEFGGGEARVHTVDHGGNPDVAFWLYISELIAIPPIQPELKFKVGDEVINRDFPEYGLGEVKDIDISILPDIPYWVKFNNGYVSWIKEENLVLAYLDKIFKTPSTPPVKPAKKYQVGDEVIHINRPQMGMGKIVKVCDDDRTYGVEIDSRGKFINMPNELNMDYIVDWQFYPNSDYAFFPSNWVHAEEFLLPARRKAD